MSRKSKGDQLSLLGDPALELARKPLHGVLGAAVLHATKSGKALAPAPWEAVIVNVDTARISGWCVTLRGVVVASGEVDTYSTSAVRAVLSQALEGARVHKLPCVLVLEKPWGGNVTVITALGAARERWLVHWRELATGNQHRVVLVSPSTHRPVVLGPEYHMAKRDDARAGELAFARLALGREPIGGDEAAATCIAAWSCRAAQVGKLLSNTSRRESLASWTKGQET